MENITSKSNFSQFLFLWSGQLFSILGSAIVGFAITWWITITTGSATLLSISTFMYILPMALLTPFAGVIADRHNRKIIIAIADSLQALTTFVVIVLFWFNLANPIIVVLIMGLRGIFQAFHVPTASAILPSMVPKEKLSRMNGINYLFISVINIIGPIFGAALYSILSIELILWIDIFTYGIAMVPLLLAKIPLMIKPKEEIAKDSYFHEFKLGVKTINLIPGLIALLVWSMVLNFLLMPANILLPYYIKYEHLGTEFDYAFMTVFFSIGMIFGSLLTSIKKKWNRKLFSYFGSLFILMGAISVFAFVPKGNYLSMWIAASIMGFMMPIGNTIYMTVIQLTVPKEKMGRVVSIDQSLSSIMSPIGAISAGPLADLIGIRPLFLIVSIIGSVGSIAVWKGTRLRKVNYNDQEELDRISESMNHVS
ncbi:MAG: MFS transporter [Candidatus Lokiarchaeota archaeon]|nr:MFS transporter [Candidatus Lokiarchaeota archaeon]